jgi:transglutaminase-like putative cysteine protease
MATVFESSIPYGYAGSMMTLARMRSIVRKSLTQPVVVEAAHRIISFLPPRQQTRQAFAIRDVLARSFQFIADPKGVELLRTPVYQIEQIKEHGVTTGDCDDAAILGAALGMAVGIAARFRVIAFRPGADFAHVYAILTPNDGPAIDLDVTKPTTGAAAPVRFQDYPV